jgi:hypothetical protein
MVFVVLHVSAPYKSTDFTFELKIFMLVPLEMFMALHTFPRMLTMTLALLILWPHTEETTKQHHQTGPQMELTRKEKQRTT